MRLRLQIPIFLLLTLALAARLQASDLVFPQFVHGRTDTGQYVSEIVFYNGTNSTSTAVVRFRGDDGSPLTVRLVSGDELSVSSAYQFSLGPGATRVFTSFGESALQVGWVEVDETAGSGLQGLLTFSFFDNSGAAKTEVGVLPSPVAQSFVIPVDLASNSNTGVALVNTTFQQAPTDDRFNIALVLVDDKGRVVATSKLLGLEGHSHLARFVSELFSVFPTNVRGTLVVAVNGLASAANCAPGFGQVCPEPADRASLVGLKLKNGLFSSIPSERGFFLPPLPVRSGETAASNDSVSTAQDIPLPFTLEGNVSINGDRDYYRAQLAQDELLVAYLEKSSGADSFALEATVHDAGGNVVDTFGPGEPIVFRARSAGTYFVSIGDRGNDAFGAYRLTAIRIQ